MPRLFNFRMPCELALDQIAAAVAEHPAPAVLCPPHFTASRRRTKYNYGHA